MDAQNASVGRVGRVLGKMRWRAERTTKAKRWVVNLAKLQRWTQAYGLEWPQE